MSNTPRNMHGPAPGKLSTPMKREGKPKKGLKRDRRKLKEMAGKFK